MVTARKGKRELSIPPMRRSEREQIFHTCKEEISFDAFASRLSRVIGNLLQTVDPHIHAQEVQKQTQVFVKEQYENPFES